MSKKRILIFGTNSILTKALIDIWKINYDLTLVYSGKKSGVNQKGLILKSKDDAFNENLNYDFVVIISAYIPEKDSDHQKLFSVNVNLVKEIVNKFNSSKIIYCSSVSLYAPSKSDIINETTKLTPQNEYAVSKLWAETIITKNVKDYAILRISSLAGVGMKGNTFIPFIVNSAFQKKQITLFGKGKRLQNYIHVTDVANMINASLSVNMNGIFLAVNTKSYSNIEVAKKVQSKIENTVIAFNGEDLSLNYKFDATETYNKLQYTPKRSINYILQELIEWKEKQS